MYDVVVVGAGPAGATAGRSCACQGLRTVIVEKHKLPRKKVCAGGVTLKSIRIIDKPIPSSVVEAQILGYDFISPSMKVARVRSAEPIGITVFRDKFDKFLTDHASSSGCKLLQGKAVVDVKVEEDLVKCRLSSGQVLKAHIAIDASGVAGVVARKTGMAHRPKIVLLGFEKELKLGKNKLCRHFDPNILEFYFSKGPMGYGWVFPKSKSVSIGFTTEADKPPSPYDGSMRFCHMLSRLKKLDFTMKPFNTIAIPFAVDPMNAVADRVILTGDAAGFVDPMTGEGIYYAMKSGNLAAKAASSALNEQDFSKSYLQKTYSETCEKEFVRGLRIALKWSERLYKHIDLFIDVLDNGANELWLRNVQDKLTYKTLEEEFVRGFPSWILQVYWNRLKRRTGFEN